MKFGDIVTYIGPHEWIARDKKAIVLRVDDRSIKVVRHDDTIDWWPQGSYIYVGTMIEPTQERPSLLEAVLGPLDDEDDTTPTSSDLFDLLGGDED